MHERHGRTPLPVYRAWIEMRRRCLDPRRKEFPRYGGRGITICARWAAFAAFRSDMGPRPSASHSLERIDTNGNYEPKNCRWATAREQANNRSTNRRFEHSGRRLTIAEWAAVTGIPYDALRARLLKGWSVARALSKPTPTMRKAAA